MRCQQPAQGRRTRLFLTFDEYRHTDRRLATVGAERSEMRCDACFVVGATAAVQPAVAFGRLEGRRHPLVGIALGLDVVMRIEQHRRRTFRCRMPGDDGRCALLADDLHITEPGLRQQLCHGLGTALDLVTARRVGAHRLDAYQIFQVAPHRRQHVAHPLNQIAHGDEVSRSPFLREQT